MKLSTIKIILDSPLLNDKEKKDQILFHIAEDEDAIKDILIMLGYERHRNASLRKELNVSLSDAHYALVQETKDSQWLKAFNKRIQELYYNYRNIIKHTYYKIEKKEKICKKNINN